MKTLLWLDDIRNPFEGDWLIFAPCRDYEDVIWCKSCSEAVDWVKKNGLPYAMCLDHDLGIPKQLEYREKGKSKRESRRLAKTEKTGYDFAKWVVNYCMDNNLRVPLYSSQSANSVGRENILMYLSNYESFIDKN